MTAVSKWEEDILNELRNILLFIKLYFPTTWYTFVVFFD